MSTCNLPIILCSIFIIACQAPENKTSQTGEGTEYIVNEHNFGDYKKFEQDKSDNELKEEQKKETSQTKEDSMKAYIKELAHHFHLQEKQMKALEYIYAKYDKKEVQSIQSGDTNLLAKLNVEREKSIEVVLGERYYTRKVAFDQDYKDEQMKGVNEVKFGFYNILPKGIAPLPRASNRYIGALKKELKLDQKQAIKLKSLIRQYEHKKALIIDSIKLNQLEENKSNYEKELLGLKLYQSKLKFDKKFLNKE